MIARILAVTRRSQVRINSEASTDFQMADLKIFPKELRAKRDQKKIEKDPTNPFIIRTIHGIGYRYEGK